MEMSHIGDFFGNSYMAFCRLLPSFTANFTVLMALFYIIK